MSKGRYRAWVLNIPLPLKMHGGVCRRSSQDGVDVQVEVVGR
jgi:hypothetical protein